MAAIRVFIYLLLLPHFYSHNNCTLLCSNWYFIIRQQQHELRYFLICDQHHGNLPADHDRTRPTGYYLQPSHWVTHVSAVIIDINYIMTAKTLRCQNHRNNHLFCGRTPCKKWPSKKHKQPSTKSYYYEDVISWINAN